MRCFTYTAALPPDVFQSDISTLILGRSYAAIHQPPHCRFTILELAEKFPACFMEIDQNSTGIFLVIGTESENNRYFATWVCAQTPAGARIKIEEHYSQVQIQSIQYFTTAML